MAMDQDELNRRRQAREERRRKRQAAQRRLYIRLAVAAAVLLACGVTIFLLSGSGEAEKPTEPSLDSTGGQSQTPSISATEATEEETRRNFLNQQDPTTVIHLVAAGDLNVTDKSVWAGQTTGNFDYTAAFMDVASIFSGADLAVLNFEGNLVGSPYGTESVSAPQQMAEALSAMGVDMVQMANSCSVNHGVSGLATTLNNIRAAGIEPVGAFSTAEEFQKSKGYTIAEVQGIKIAFVAFTKGVGGLTLPAGSEECVNLLYTDYSTTYKDIDKDSIRRILRNVEEEKPDITVAMLHWGSAYKDSISSGQKSILSLMQDEGVDVILGTHSHLLHQITYDDVTGEFVAYSLGDFFGDAERGGTNYSVILDLEITRDNESGQTRVTSFEYIPIYTLSEAEGGGQRRVVRIREAMKAYEENYVDRITKTAYDNMDYALDRIEARIKGPEEKK
ncbi:MAG: CapA family protein [Oscillospiraceae bacterium]|nr:CapA family protein [Oscillospiraceae bacterium]